MNHQVSTRKDLGRYRPVAIEDLRIGMYIAPQRAQTKNADVPMLVSGLVESVEQINQLRAGGVRSVWIDSEKGESPDEMSTIPTVIILQPDQALALSPKPKTVAEQLMGPDWNDACESSQLKPEQIARLPRTEDVQYASQARDMAMRQMDVILSGAKTGAPVDGEAIKDTTQSLVSSILDCPAAMQFVMGSDRNNHQHEAMVAHAVHVATMTILVGKYTSRESFDVSYCNGLGALLHDIGETHLPLQIHTASLLTEVERRIVERHTELGLRMLRNVHGIPAESLRIVAEHHERMDGTGYPNGLQGRRIYEGSQLVGALDVYDAMLSLRMYRQALSPTEAIRAVYRMAQKAIWDEEVISRIVATLGVYPVGTKVLLNTNEQAMVVMINDDRLRPVVRLLTDRGGEAVSRTKLVDLQNQHDLWIVRLMNDQLSANGNVVVIPTLG